MTGQHRDPSSAGLPMWLKSVATLVLLGLLGYNIVVVGADGLPNSYVLGGLLGALFGVDQLVKGRNGGGGGP